MYDKKLNSKRPKNTNAWIVTFADLMALLLTFFIMLFSMSNMDSIKYKAVSEAIGGAFNAELGQKAESLIDLKSYHSKVRRDSIVQLNFTKYAEEIFQSEIKDGLLEISAENGKTIIRFPESVTFPSGSATLNDNFIPVLNKVGKILANSSGKIVISGHSDNQPISTNKYRSNWDLSSSRAVSVVHKILEGNNIQENRFIVQGFADTMPLRPNTTSDDRMINRRVEIAVENSLVNEN